MNTVMMRRIRHRRAMSMAEVARAAGISYSGYRKIEDGRSENPRAETVRRLAEVFGVTAAEIQGFDPWPNS